ncbi:MAG: hypothetical protein FE038_00760 [Thermoplasmata archaeon]|nr:MAG: hypothetical protein FE038_00760 [Thermoplasmata archaeon]
MCAEKVKKEYGRGAKVGALVGFIVGLIGVPLFAFYEVINPVPFYPVQFLPPFPAGTLPLFISPREILLLVSTRIIIPLQGIISGLIFGVIFARVYDKLPGLTLVKKGLVLGVIWYLFSVAISLLIIFASNSFLPTYFSQYLILEGWAVEILRGFLMGKFFT